MRADGDPFFLLLSGGCQVERYGDGCAVHDAVNNVTAVYRADGSKKRFSGLLEAADAGAGTVYVDLSGGTLGTDDGNGAFLEHFAFEKDKMRGGGTAPPGPK